MAKKVAPPTRGDAKMSREHLMDSIKFNKAHAKDHEKAMKKAAKLLKDKKYFAVKTRKVMK